MEGMGILMGKKKSTRYLLQNENSLARVCMRYWAQKVGQKMCKMVVERGSGWRMMTKLASLFCLRLVIITDVPVADLTYVS